MNLNLLHHVMFLRALSYHQELTKYLSSTKILKKYQNFIINHEKGRYQTTIMKERKTIELLFQEITRMQLLSIKNKPKVLFFKITIMQLSSMKNQTRKISL